MAIFAYQKKKIMDIKMNYKITVLTSKGIHEGFFLTEKTAKDLIVTLRDIDDDFRKGILQEYVDGRWVQIWTLEKGLRKDSKIEIS